MDARYNRMAVMKIGDGETQVAHTYGIYTGLSDEPSITRGVPRDAFGVCVF